MDEKNRLFEEFDTKKIDEFLGSNLDSLRDQVFIEEKNRDLVDDLIRYGAISNQLSASGPLAQGMVIQTVNATVSGQDYTVLSPNESEVYLIQTAHVAVTGGSGSIVHRFKFSDGSTESQWFYQSSGGSDVILTSDDNWPQHPLYTDSNLKVIYDATGTFTSVALTFTFARVR